MLCNLAEAARLVSSQGLYLNNKPVASTDYRLELSDLVDGKVAFLRAGRSKHLILALS